MHSTRRRFLERTAWLAAAAAVPSSVAWAEDDGVAIEPGLQLYTMRALLEEDFAGTLEQVAAIGYREVQVSGRAGHPPEAIRKMLDDHGLVTPAIHVDLQGTTSAEIEATQALGAAYAYLSVPRPALRIERGKVRGLRDDLTLDDWRRIADDMNEEGAAYRAAGLGYGYHNHGFEFEAVDGVLPFDLLLERTDPELVSFEIDFGWTHKAEVDPLPYFAKYPGRFPVCHVKDVDGEGDFVDPGTGRVDFARIFAHAKQAGLRHYFVEHDTTKDPLRTARAGHAFLSASRAR